MLSVVASQAVPGKTGMRLLARVVGKGATPITNATITSIAVTVTDLTKEAQTAGSGFVATHNPSVASVLSDALNQTDLAWTRDSAIDLGPDKLWGFNFDTTLPATDFANSGDLFQVDCAFTPVSGEPFRIIWRVPSLQVFA